MDWKPKKGYFFLSFLLFTCLAKLIFQALLVKGDAGVKVQVGFKSFQVLALYVSIYLSIFLYHIFLV